MGPVVFEIAIFFGAVVFAITQLIVLRSAVCPSFRFRKTAIKLEDAIAEDIDAQEQVRITEIKQRAERNRDDARYGFRKDG